MAHVNTVFSQILKLVPRHEFESLAKECHKGQKLRKMSRWSQFVAMSFGQLAGRMSLRDVVTNLRSQTQKLYHLNCCNVSRTTLARVNEAQPYTLYEALFGKLLLRCQSVAPKKKFKFHNKLYSIDASTIDLCLTAFPWAKFRQRKGAIKLHVGLDHDGYLPTFVDITEGKTHEVNVARSMVLPKESIVVMDRGYTDYSWYNSLNDKGVFFVCRLKKNADYRVIERRPVRKTTGLSCDQTIRFSGSKAKECPILLRRIGYRDAETGKHYVFLTNNFKLTAKTIADIYKSRWQIELFFKWIKQNLKIKTFLGTSKNAVLTQIWIAMCVYLMTALMIFSSKIELGHQQIIRLLQLNLFERRDVISLLKQEPPPPKYDLRQTKLAGF